MYFFQLFLRQLMSIFFQLTAINGYVFESGPDLGFCYGEVPTWHVSSIGAQDYIQTATFYGHSFELNHRTEDILSLYPMTGETIKITMDNIGDNSQLQTHFFYPLVLSGKLVCRTFVCVFASQQVSGFWHH